MPSSTSEPSLLPAPLDEDEDDADERLEDEDDVRNTVSPLEREKR